MPFKLARRLVRDRLGNRTSLQICFNVSISCISTLDGAFASCRSQQQGETFTVEFDQLVYRLSNVAHGSLSFAATVTWEYCVLARCFHLLGMWC